MTVLIGYGRMLGTQVLEILHCVMDSSNTTKFSRLNCSLLQDDKKSRQAVTSTSYRANLNDADNDFVAPRQRPLPVRLVV
jgi:hypothetical protein